MARRIRGYWAVAGGLAALSCTLLICGTKMGAAQSNQDTPQANEPPMQSLGRGSGQMNAGEQYTGSAAEFLKVPLSRNIPGAVKLRPKIKSPVADDPAAAERGMRYFASFNCVGCHAANGGGGMGPSLSDAAFKFGSAPENLFVVISHGAPLGMPAWGALLPEEVIWDLVAYVESISKPPSEQWGSTVSPAAQMPGIEQVPAEFKQSATPWQFTEPFGNGKAPSGSGSGAAGLPSPPSSGSSRQ